MIGAMSEPDRDRRPVRRRTALLGLAGGLGALALGGCGIRLEHDRPPLPFMPTGTHVPAESALVAVTTECATLAAAARAGGSSALLTDLAAVHDRQHDVLVTVLRARQVPDRVLSSPAVGASSPAGAPARPPSGAAALAALAAAEAADLATPLALAAVETALRPTACALLAQRYAAARLLGGTPPDAPLVPGAAPADAASPTGPGSAAPGAGPVWTVPTDLLPVLAATRSAVYGFEVVAAQTTGTRTRLARASLRTLRSLVAEQVSALGAAAPPPALGYPLPFPVGTAARAVRLADHLADGLRSAYGAALPALTASSAAASFSHLPWWLGRAEVLARHWGRDLEPFPGLA